MAIPELKRLAAAKKPFFLFLRHMDPHSPYLPPRPFERMFYGGNEFDKRNHSLDPVMTFKPFCDYFASWFPPGCTDKDYIIAQYDGAVAYMDACIANIFAALKALKLEEDTLVVIDSDHGETLYDHECFFDHHGIYDCHAAHSAGVRAARQSPGGRALLRHLPDEGRHADDPRSPGHQDRGSGSTGAAWCRCCEGRPRAPEPEFYITECTWMRKHGWRTPEWKLIHALEPDFHFKPEVELYNLVTDPEENHNLAEAEPDVVELLEARMQAHIARREKETGRKNPIYTNLNWHWLRQGAGPFKTSRQAYDTLHIGSPKAAKELQAEGASDPARREDSSRQATMLITVIGRGHSGTRAMSHTLYASGVFMGTCSTNPATCCRPQDMYEACRVMARYVVWKGGLEWDFSRCTPCRSPGIHRR